uniref:Uncharacterized protein n=1 Tax=Oryza punctata TaxID=4537 RepID=A0A0E0KPW4_ORYPU
MAARRSAADELDEATRAQADPDYLLFLSHLYPDGGGAASSSSTYVLDIPDLGLVVRYGPFVIGGDGDDGCDDASNKTTTVERRQLSSVVIDDDDLPPPSAREAEVDSAPSRSSVASYDDVAAGTVDDGEEVSKDGIAGEEGTAAAGKL